MKLLLFIALLISAPFALAQKSEPVTGSLLLLIEDDFERGIAREIYQIHEDKTSNILSLRFPNNKVPEEIKNIPAGAKVKASGKRENGYFHLEKIERLKK